MTDKPAGKTVTIQIDRDGDHGFWVGVAPQDKGQRGILVASHDRWALGDRAQIQAHLAGISKPLTVECEAVWYVPDAGDGRPFGVGLVFRSLDARQQEALKRFFSRQKPDLYQWDRRTETLERTSRLREQQKQRAQKRKLTIQLGPGSDNGLWVGFMEDIAEGGIFVATQDRWQEQEAVDVDLHVPGERKPLSLGCRVRWLRQDAGDAVPGIGLSWDGELGAKPLEALRRYIDKHRPELMFWDE